MGIGNYYMGHYVVCFHSFFSGDFRTHNSTRPSY